MTAANPQAFLNGVDVMVTLHLVYHGLSNELSTLEVCSMLSIQFRREVDRQKLRLRTEDYAALQAHFFQWAYDLYRAQVQAHGKEKLAKFLETDLQQPFEALLA